jgi:pteridine reductase
MRKQDSTTNRRIALVTGAGTRVGRSIALELARAQFDVAVHYFEHRAGADEVVNEAEALGCDARSYKANLADRDEVRELVGQVASDFGAIDLLVPNAAIFERVEFEDIGDTDWDRMLQLNLTSTVALAQSAAPNLRERCGNIVFITCASVEAPYRHHLPYVVSKAGVYQAMRAMALELAPLVRVNAVAPGTVLPPEALDVATLERLRRAIPLARFGSPDDIAKAVRFLADADFITGQQLVVDGGRSIALASADG